MTVPGGNTAQLAARFCEACGHYHGGRAYGLCLMHDREGRLCPCNVVQTYGPAIIAAEPASETVAVAVPEMVAPKAARRAWFTDRWRWAHFETRTHSGVSTLAMYSLRRRRG